mmetsp:Transcript_36932/g.104212  ORF Transcript_36932/g.104212 Transcript_36932/m.104212 type:complete len:264 (-) Transcript_36932:596-1387(-)
MSGWWTTKIQKRRTKTGTREVARSAGGHTRRPSQARESSFCHQLMTSTGISFPAGRAAMCAPNASQAGGGTSACRWPAPRALSFSAAGACSTSTGPMTLRRHMTSLRSTRASGPALFAQRHALVRTRSSSAEALLGLIGTRPAVGWGLPAATPALSKGLHSGGARLLLPLPPPPAAAMMGPATSLLPGALRAHRQHPRLPALSAPELHSQAPRACLLPRRRRRRRKRMQGSRSLRMARALRGPITPGLLAAGSLSEARGRKHN